MRLEEHAQQKIFQCARDYLVAMRESRDRGLSDEYVRIRTMLRQISAYQLRFDDATGPQLRFYFTRLEDATAAIASVARNELLPIVYEWGGHFDDDEIDDVIASTDLKDIAFVNAFYGKFAALHMAEGETDFVFSVDLVTVTASHRYTFRSNSCIVEYLLARARGPSASWNFFIRWRVNCDDPPPLKPIDDICRHINHCIQTYTH